MKCPICGVWSLVKETRGTRRRRECANEHRFTTEETVIPEEVLKQKQREHLKSISEKRMVAVRSGGRKATGSATQTINH